MNTRRKEDVITTHSIVEETLDSWAEADSDGNITTAKQRLEFFINFISSFSILIKQACSDGEIEEIQSALLQLKEAKQALRKINTQLQLAC